MTLSESADSIVEFWFSDKVRPLWFQSTPEFDAELRDRFESVWQQAAAGKLDIWATTVEGALALVIVLDQFPLNMFRGDALCFSTEAKSREIANLAIENNLDVDLTDEQKAFLYMPFMHSESLVDQDKSVALYEAAGLAENLKFAKHHRDIVRRFGRFPHRNEILGRPSTEEELAYLQSDEAFHG
ncbi:MAG: DUF924 domain-containing protein [Gammaproteobacteria bacterium]|nr:DUF924 domain-containing protein [Gammaproteobacteria bacterium]